MSIPFIVETLLYSRVKRIDVELDGENWVGAKFRWFYSESNERGAL